MPRTGRRPGRYPCLHCATEVPPAQRIVAQIRFLQPGYRATLKAFQIGSYCSVLCAERAATRITRLYAPDEGTANADAATSVAS